MVLLWLIIALVVCGIIMMYSASFAYAYYNRDGDSNFFFRNQLIFAVIGLVGMFAVSLFPAVRFKNFNLLVLTISTVLLIVVLFLPKVNGVHRWINLGVTTFQPSEITKFAVILFGATWADSHADKMHTFKWGVLPFMCVLGASAFLLILEPHLSCTVIVMLLGLTMMWVGGTRLVWFAGLGIVIATGIVAVILSGQIGYSSARIEVWLDPFADPLGDGWQNIQALYAISSGGLFGSGLGNSRQKYLYISEPQNDFVFSVVCEELGFIGAALVIALFVVFVWRGFTVSVNNPNRFCKLLGIGITAQVGWQALLNMAVVTKMVPNTGISLPFFSYGGTSLVMLLLEMGVLLAISRGSTAKRI
ncbi:MAG: putative lipid II flippase FtsW [Ruminococcaceae bacterium]|nr:putative lipid II flippase FtsW [Oscillospiraceae bacterium]